VGLALLGGTVGVTAAQEASPESSPVASPVALASWVEDLIDNEFDVADGDTTTVGIIVDDAGDPPIVIQAASFETRPFVQLQTDNKNATDIVAVLLTAPAEFDATGFTLPADVAELPEGVTPVTAYDVAAGTQVTAIFPDLAPGTYVIATSNGQALSFVVTEQVAVDVPDIFATPAT
jgi:hypothetical protein